METKKSTAVEYLVKEISAILGPLETKPMQDLLIVDTINKAKQMEKEQIINAYTQGDKDGYPDGSYITGEQYYNETFGSNNETDSSPEMVSSKINIKTVHSLKKLIDYINSEYTIFDDIAVKIKNKAKLLLEEETNKTQNNE